MKLYVVGTLDKLTGAFFFWGGGGTIYVKFDRNIPIFMEWNL